MNGKTTATLLVLLIAPLAVAGSAAEPEITDPPGDTSNELTGEPVLAPGADILAAWFTEDSGRFRVHVRVTDLQPAQPAVVDLWTVEFNAIDARMKAEMQRSFDGTVVGLSSPGRSGPSTFDGTATGTADTAADVITIDLPRSFDLRDATTTTHYTFVLGTRLASPVANASRGHGTSDTGILLTRLDQTPTGRDFVFGTSATSDNLWSGTKPTGEDIDTDYVKLDGVSIRDQRGVGSFQTYEFKVRTENKEITWHGTTTTLHKGDVVRITDFQGKYVVTGGNTRFNGTAATMTIN